MKIAITADVHLSSREKNPERFHALENILDQLVDLNIHTLIIAGDLFDATCKDPAELEKLIQNKKYAQISVYIVPGNHDPVISRGAFTLQNIKYLTSPQLVEFSRDACFLFQPYEPNSSMGEALAACPFQLEAGAWVLVAHGDNLASARLGNRYEDGLYMPLSGRDIMLFKPKKVFLGHIHASMDTDVVHYPGSPCGLDPTETGIRSFMVYDTSNGKVERIPIETDVIYFQESLTILPLDDEEAYIRQILEKKIAKWNLDEGQKMKARIRIITQGYSTNREKLSKTIIDLLSQHQFTLEEVPDLSKVKISSDVMRAEIAAAVQKRIIELEIPENHDEPTRDEYILAAMNQIYRG